MQVVFRAGLTVSFHTTQKILIVTEIITGNFSLITYPFLLQIP